MKKNLYIIIILITQAFCLWATSKNSLFKANGKYGIINENRKILLPANFTKIVYNDVFLCITEDSGAYVYNDRMELLHKFTTEEKNVKICSPVLFQYSKGEGFYKKYFVFNLTNGISEKFMFQLKEDNTVDSPWIAGQGGFFSNDLIMQNFGCNHSYPYRSKRAVILNLKREGEIIDEEFNIVLDRIFAAADYYSEKLLPVIMMDTEGKAGESVYVNTAGECVWHCDFDFNYIWRDEINCIQVPEVTGSFNEDVAVVQKADGNWLILNKNFEKTLIPDEYKVEIPAFKNGLLLVSKEVDDSKKFGFIDKNCCIIIPFEYEVAEPFFGNYAIVSKHKEDGIVDKTGSFFRISELN